MHQTLSDYDDRDDGLHLVGEDRGDEFSRADRRLPKIFLSLLAMALFAGGLWFAYVQGTRHPAAGVQGGVQGDGVALIRADERPTKVKPDQPGGMAIPDQNVSLYNEKPGGAQVENLLPAAPQPMPRPAPAPKEAAIAPPPTPPAPAAPVASPPASAPAAAPAASSPAKPAAKAAPPPAAKTAPQPRQPAPVAAVAVPPGKGPIQLRLASLRSPEAAREEWARLKRENSDLLGNLTAVAVRTDLGDQGIYYRIQAGSFGDAAAAEKLCGELKRRKLGCILAR
ncbi:MAG TPA: SPOR domain-containing protein [Stellaceae bacterium]